MIVCSCTVITDADIETAIIEIMSAENSPIPTPGIVYRHLSKKMNCCGCTPILVKTIYERMTALEAQGLICPCACKTAQNKLLKLKPAKSGIREKVRPNKSTDDTARPMTSVSV